MNLLLSYLSTLVWGPIVAGFILAYLFLTGITKFWELRDVAYIKPQLLFGNFYNVLVNKENFVIKVKNLYDAIKGPFGGIYLFTQPVLIVRDPEIIQQMLLIDFNKFTDRGLLTSNLLVLKGEQWRPITDIIKPIFVNDMRTHMFDALKKTSGTLQEHVDRVSKSNNIFELSDLMARFASATTASTVFSMNVDSINNSDDMFYKIGRLIATPTRCGQLRSVLAMTVPNLVKYFNMRTIDVEIESFLLKAIGQTLELRESGRVVEHDYMQLLVQLRNGGKFNENCDWNIEPVAEKCKHQTIDEIVAQLFLFYVIIFDTASTAMSFALFEIARNKEIEYKIQTEIDKVLEGNDITYESVKKMSYLDQVLNETLRKYPSISIVARSPLKPYRIPNTAIILDENQEVFLPIYALHHDSKYYERPDEFIPERFATDEIEKRKPRTYYPFGDASRTCIRTSYAFMQAKVAIIAICSKFNLELAPDRSPDIKFCTVGSLNVEGSLKVKFTRRTHKNEFTNQ